MTAPLICALIGELLEIEAINDVPFASMIGQTIPIVLVPIILGLTIRHFYPAWTVRQQQSMERLSFLAISLLIIIIVSSTYDLLTPAVVQWAVVMAILFTAVLSGLGSLIARFAAPSLNKSQWSAIMFGFPARNLGLAALLAINVFGIIEMATFGVIFFVVQAFLLVPLAIVLRRERILR